MRNRSYKHTCQKIEDDPNYRFHSEWHYQRHLQASDDIRKEIRFDDIWGMIFGVIATIGLIAVIASHAG